MKPAAEAPASAGYQQDYGQSAYNMDGHLTATVAAAAQARPAQAQRHADITITAVEPPAARYAADEIDADEGLLQEPESHHHAEAPFIPPPVEAPPSRMPRVEDFPPVAQRQFEAHRDAPAAEEDRGPLSLLRRLANVGLGRREDDPIGAGPQRGPAQPQAQRPAAPQQRPQQARPAAAAPQGGDYAKRPPTPRAPAQDGLYRPRQGDLDAHGRPLPGAARSSDDELEIPAFLRRQAN
jgi:cell division protein FtsZ